jgi:hypothetical protein
MVTIFSSSQSKLRFIAETAEACHEVNRHYCAAIGDASQVPWREAPEWQRRSCVAGVEYALDHPGATPEESHRSWLDTKLMEGWKYGPIKDYENREHPCLVAYEDLPGEQRVKDLIFLSVVRWRQRL